MIISIDNSNNKNPHTFDKTQHPLIKSLGKLEIEGKFLKLLKVTYKNLTVIIIP